MVSQAVILIDHGSPDPKACEPLMRLAAVVADRVGLKVYPAHMSAAAPTIADAVAEAIAAGAVELIVSPCLLTAGRHVRETIPALVADAAAAWPEVHIRIAEPIGMDSALADLIVRRLRPHMGPQEA